MQGSRESARGGAYDDLSVQHGRPGGRERLRYHNLQFILSRRNPALVEDASARPFDREWGLTVVRRESHGKESSVYTYLAPLGAGERPREGSILHFAADSMPLFPQGDQPYARGSAWGSLVKLYEYECKGSKTHMLRRDGILSRVELLLPEVALPARFYECRSFGGHSGSNATNLNGLRVRLEDDRQSNIEPGFPSSGEMVVDGEKMTTRLYVFKRGVEETYKKNEGVIFTVNGQTHGHLTNDFFGRKAVGHSYLRSSILVTVDCSELSGRAREDLFMNSRDRLSRNEIRYRIERELEDLLRRDQELRRLRERRRREELDARLEESKPLADMLTAMINRSPNLSALFLRGNRISDPFKTIEVGDQDKPYRGEKYPTFFRFKGKDCGYVLKRDAHMGQRARIVFETDACNDYLSRSVDRGRFTLMLAVRNGDGDREVEGEFHFASPIGPPMSMYEVTQAIEFLAEEGLKLTPKGLVAGSHLFGRLWDLLAQRRSAGPPRMVNFDGEDLVFHTATYRITDEKAARETLAARADVERDEDDGDEYTLSGAPLRSQPGIEAVALGRLLFVGDELLLEVDSAGRLERARRWLDSVPGLKFEKVSSRPLNQVLAEGVPLDDKLGRSKLEMTPELEAWIREDLRRQYFGWLDTPVPMFGGKTPREMARTKAGRARVAAHIRGFPRANDQVDMPVPIEEMLRELGIDEEDGE